MTSVEECYELSPMQQGMLYHTLAAPHSGAYCIVVSYELHGRLDAPAFILAWRELVKRHPVLRTSFHWKDRAQSVQVVHPNAELQVEEQDWRGLSPSEREARLKTLLSEEARRGFELTEPPLIRLTLIRATDAMHQLVLANHHLVLDGWCKFLLFEELFAFYETFRQGHELELPLPRPYRDYIMWLREQDLSKAEVFWKQELQRFKEPTRLWPEPSPEKLSELEPGSAEHPIEVDPADAEALRLFGRRHRLTLNTIVQGMWAVLLSRCSGSHDVVFGATVSGRQASLTGVESMVGLFINTLPVRAQISPDSSLAPWLQALQLQQARARENDHSSLSQIQRWSEVAGGQRLFESIVVFENNVGFGRERYGSIAIGDTQAVVNNGLPLTLRCVPEPVLSFQILYDRRRYFADTVRRIAEQAASLLRHFPQGSDAPIASLFELLDESDKQQRAMKAKAFESSMLDKLKRIKRTGRRV